MRILFLLVAIPILCAQANAQWIKIFGGNQGPTLRGVYFVNNKVGYVVGGQEFFPGSATIVKTTDGGWTWTVQVAGVDTGLRAIYCIDENNCIACGYAGNILKTTNGGATWTLKPSGTTQTLRSIDFINQSVGFVCGGAGVILKTTDFGETWTPVANSGTTQDLINIRFANSNVGYAVSSTAAFSSGIVIKTTDGGNNWYPVYTNPQGLLGLAVVNENVVFAGGGNNQGSGPSNYAYIVKTTDGGNTWSQVYAGYGFRTFRGAEFVSPSKGWFVGDLGYLLRTEDGGATWLNDSIHPQGLLGIHFPTSDTGYAVGNLALILKYGSSCTPMSNLVELSGPAFVCSGDTVTYTTTLLSNATYYDWKLPMGSTLIAGQGTASIQMVAGMNSGPLSVTAYNNCDTTNTLTLNLTIAISPPPPVITFQNGVLSSTSASAYQWYLNGNPIPGATNQTYVPVQNGLYYVMITENDCSAMSNVINVVGVGMQIEQSPAPLWAVPNPLQGAGSIICHVDKGELLMTDMFGRVQWKEKMTAPYVKHVHADQLPAGMYWLLLRDDTGRLLARLKWLIE